MIASAHEWVKVVPNREDALIAGLDACAVTGG
jgi:hypothetical protein